MSFVMPFGYDAENAPIPSSARVSVSDQVRVKVVAVEFQGFATDGEIRRQLDALQQNLRLSGLAESVNMDTYQVLQYNPPYTLPFLRRNEIILKVSGRDTASSEEESSVSDGSMTSGDPETTMDGVNDLYDPPPDDAEAASTPVEPGDELFMDDDGMPSD